MQAEHSKENYNFHIVKKSYSCDNARRSKRFSFKIVKTKRENVLHALIHGSSVLSRHDEQFRKHV